MEYLIGVALAIGAGIMASITGFDRERSFYPVVMIVIASYYVLFALIDGTSIHVLIETVFMSAFTAAAIAGFKRSQWLVVAALVAHGIFDCLHPLFISGGGVPPWWPGFCLAYDGVAAAYLAARLHRHPTAVAD